MDKPGFVKNILLKKGLNLKYMQFIASSWSITWPILMIMLFTMFMNLTDVYVAGLIGTSAQAAVGMASQTYYVFIVVVQAITVGTIAVLSRIFGAEHKGAKFAGAVFSAVIFAAVCSVAITAVAFAITPVAIAKVRMEPDVKEIALHFMQIYCMGLFFNLMMLHFNGILRSCMMVRFSMIVMVGASILNIILTVFLSFYTPLGYRGIAAATAICWALAFMVTAPVIWGLMKPERKLSMLVVKNIFNISWPSGIVSFSWQFASVALYAIVGLLPESREVMAALTSGLRIEAIIYMPGFAFNMANAVLIGGLLGEGKKDEAYKMGLVTTFIGVSLIVVLTAAVIATASPIASVIASKTPEGLVDPGVLRETTRYLRVVMISEPFMAANLILGGALSGAGDTRALMRYSLFSLWILRIPVAYIFAIKLGYGASALWWAMNVTFFSQAFLAVRRYLSRKWLSI